VHENGLLDLLTRSGRPCTSRSCVVQPGWWYSWPMTSTLASLCLSQRRTYVVTVNLFSLYLLNFMFHTMLDAAGIVLRMHYKSVKCDFYFHKIAYVHYLGEMVRHFKHMSKTFLPIYNSAKIIKIDRDFPKLWWQMYCYLFMVHSVYMSSINVLFLFRCRFCILYTGKEGANSNNRANKR